MGTITQPSEGEIPHAEGTRSSDHPWKSKEANPHFYIFGTIFHSFVYI